jgi:alcohol dehydrogenase class IV
MNAAIVLPETLLIGGGALNELPMLLDRLHIRKPLIVSDPFMRQAGVVGRLDTLARLNGSNPAVFADTVPEPATRVVYEGLAVYEKHMCDGLIALGGGSPIDIAKAIGMLAANGGKLNDYKVPNSIPRKGRPLIAIPTTAGTGSEVTRFMVITDEITQEKMLIAGAELVPAAAIIDYELTLTAPPRLTADTGLDALTHSIEAFVSKKANQFSDSMALAAMSRIAANIRVAVRDSLDRAARSEMMVAATQAGIAFSCSSVALVHGMSRPLGALFHVPHGLSNAMLLPIVTQFSLSSAKERYAQCARTMGVADTGSTDEVAAGDLVESLRVLNRDLQVPTPAEYGIDSADYHRLARTMAQQALSSGSPANNPKSASVEDMIELYERAYS